MVATASIGNGAAIQQAPPARANTLQAFLEQPSVKARLEQAAARFMKPDDLIRLALMAASRQPDIMKCSPVSVLRALMDAATVGVVPGGTNGRGYIIPRKNRATGQLEACFDPGWRGLADIAKRTGKVTRIEAQVVYAADLFQVELGLEPSIVHTPAYDVEDRGAIVAAYAVAYFADGQKQFEVLTKQDIAKIRGTSAAQGGPWKTWEDEMSRKSAVRRLVKYLPVYDATLERALEMSTDVESGERSVMDTTSTPALTHSSQSLEDAILAEQPQTVTPDGEVVETAKAGDA